MDDIIMDDIIIGDKDVAKAIADHCVAIGNNCLSSHDYSMVIGDNLSSDHPYQIKIKIGKIDINVDLRDEPQLIIDLNKAIKAICSKYYG